MSKAIPFILGWALANMKRSLYNSPGADELIVNPPQSEESKQYYIERAKEKRIRKHWRFK